jgi:CDP-glycerol glycerophosphotransferase (TagB/SpsB family)
MLSALRGLLHRSTVREVLLRPHPLARNEYLAEISSDLPIKITSESISDLLGRVGAVLVSYSSIGEEALKLGIPVYFVQIPGLISESPLAEIKPGGGWIVNRQKRKHVEPQF